MRIATRWVCEKPSILLAIIAITALTQTTLCNAENTTLTQVSNYSFTEGFYNVLKFAEDDQSEYWIMYETKIPYLNISYTAPKDGFLEVTLTPTQGSVPYIELNKGWDTDGVHYGNNMLSGETAYMILRPPMVFSDSNMTRIVDGSISIWEIYTWDDIEGRITYSFMGSDDITLELVVHPSNPRQGDKIHFFTLSNADLNSITWRLTGDHINWVNSSDTLEINSLPMGDYTIQVTGYDAFNELHQSHATFNVRPPVIDPTVFDVDFFSVNYPTTVDIGDSVSVTATIDYSIPNTTEIKCILSDSSGAECHASTYTLVDSGSKQFTYNYITHQSGCDTYSLRLLYDLDGEWVELSESTTQLTIQVAEAKTTPSIPGFSIFSVITVIVCYTLLRTKRMKMIRNT